MSRIVNINVTRDSLLLQILGDIQKLNFLWFNRKKGKFIYALIFLHNIWVMNIEKLACQHRVAIDIKMYAMRQNWKCDKTNVILTTANKTYFFLTSTCK